MWPEDPLDDTMIINMGPQHPSTHGVLRLMMELDSEEVLRVKPVIGYLHTGMEKTAEELTYVQGGTNVTRMDYAAPLSNELVYSMAVERLLDLEVPPRATWIRMMLVELNRMSSHLLFQATNGMDIGAVSMMLYGWREREEVLRYLEYVTGLRMNHNFIRPGGVAADLPDGWQERVLELVRHGGARRGRVRRAAVGEPDLARANRRHRAHQHRGVPGAQHHRTDPALDRIRVGSAQGAAVPRLRRRRLRRHVRRATATCSIATGCGSRRSSSRSRSCGSAWSACRPATTGCRTRSSRRRRARASTSRWKRSSTTSSSSPKASRCPAGETYVSIESPRGEIGCYMVSDGSGKPVRMHIRGPSFYNLQSIEPMGTGSLVADAVAIVSSVDPIMGEVDR